MKKILNALFVALLAVFTFSSCSDVPAPYEILEPGSGNQGGVQPTGEGTKENPYNVVAAQQNQNGSVAWVEGYIVGTIENVYDEKGEFAGNKANFSGPFEIKTNVMIAASADETNEKNCLPVKLKGGSDLSNALNLQDHPENLKGKLLIQGKLSKGFGKAALVETTAAVFNDKEVGEEQGGGTETPEDPKAIFQESFKDGQGQFTIDTKVKPAGSTNEHVWHHNQHTTGNTMRASAFINGKNEPSEDWLVSPEIDLANVKAPKLVFSHAINFDKTDARTQVMTLQVKEVSKEWAKVEIPTYPDGQSWNHVVATVDLAAYTGKKVQFAFVYKSTADAAPVWDVKDVKVTSEEGGQVTPPVAGEEVVVTKDAAYEESFASEFGKFTVEDKELGGLDFVWKIDTDRKYAKGNAYNGSTGVVAESWLVSPVLNLNALSKVSLNFSQCSFSAGQKEEFMLKVKNVTDNVDWANVDFEMTTEKWKWIDNTVDLSAYAGKKIQIAFAYKNENSANANTWEVKNVKVSDGQGGGTVEPEPQPQPGDKVYTSNIKLPESTTTDANKASGGTVSVAGTEYPILKLGTGKALGFWMSPALKAGSTKVAFYALGWSGKNGKLTVTIENGGSFDGGVTSKDIDLNGATAGVAGNPPFTVTPADGDYYEFTLTGITASSTIKFSTEKSTSDKRAIVFGINVK